MQKKYNSNLKIKVVLEALKENSTTGGRGSERALSGKVAFSITKQAINLSWDNL
jgi:formiminotetrahydrofolate cyclodeaminase